MKNASLLPVSCLLFLIPACTLLEQSAQSETPKVVVAERVQGPEADVDAIREVGESILNSLKEGDVDAAMNGFADDVILVPQGHPVVRGKDQVRLFYKTQLETYDLRDFAPALEELVVSGDWAFSRGTSIVVVNPKGHDDTIKVINRGMEIWMRQPDGTWKLSRGIGNQSR